MNECLGFLECVIKKLIISFFSTKTYVVDTQKNRLNVTVLFNTQNVYVVDAQKNRLNETVLFNTQNVYVKTDW